MQSFLVVAAAMTGALVRGWSRPSCVAQELALRCLLDQVEILEDSYLKSRCLRTWTVGCSFRTPWTASRTMLV